MHYLKWDTYTVTLLQGNISANINDMRKCQRNKLFYTHIIVGLIFSRGNNFRNFNNIFLNWTIYFYHYNIIIEVKTHPKTCTMTFTWSWVRKIQKFLETDANNEITTIERLAKENLL